jgi:hypothetical protein
MLTLKRTWDPRSHMALQIVLCPEVNTPSCGKYALRGRGILYERSTPAVWWCRNHSQNCIRLQTVVWMPNSRAISHRLLHCSHSTPAMNESLLIGVHAARGRLAFTCAVNETFPISRRRCSKRRNTLAPGWRSAYSPCRSTNCTLAGTEG